ncbi:MAG: hypothetical protein MUP19_02160 [Candidatus Aminicenantes bacterium]|nr:hypothetical protein [Candidatus Aminicenantes bacterium]
MIFQTNWRGDFSALFLRKSARVCLTLLLLFFSFSLNAKIPAQEAAQQGAEVKISFDPGFDPLVPAKRSASGEILVQPMINDQEAGWFRLDPAVQGMRISAAAAQSFGLTRSGTARLITSSNKTEERPLWSGARFQLGPLLAEGLEFAEMSEPALPAEDEQVAGVVGIAVFQAAVVELELDNDEVRLFDPAVYEGEQAAWLEFGQQGGLPTFNCRFEGDREAKFGLDLRSPLGIIFFSQAVLSMELLKDRPSQPVKVSGATFRQASAQKGSLQWFEASGLRIEAVPAVFFSESIGLPAEKDLAGLLGREILKGCLLVLDFAQSRLSLQKKSEGS